MKGSKCFFCNSYRSYLRIVTPNLGYDQVACQKHISDLEKHADATLGSGNGVLRMHVSSTGILFRGAPYPDIESLLAVVPA